MKQGDNVFVWGATGGIGAYAIQLVLNGGGTPVGVVSSEQPGRSCSQAMGCEHVIDRRAEGYQFWSDEHTQDEGEWRRLGKKVRGLIGEDPDIVFEHPGRSTMGASVFIAKRGGTIVTCAATSGYMLEYDNRHLWMKLKRIVSSPLRQLPGGVGHEPPHRPGPHPAGDVGGVRPRATSARRADAVHRTRPRASSACCASRPRPASASQDPEKRERIGEDKITLFQRHAAGEHRRRRA